MKAEELRKLLDGYISRGHTDDEVVIRCKEPSVGAHASEPVARLSAGFDWDNGRLLIEPEKDLIHKDLQRDVPMPALRIIYKNNYNGKVRPTIHCPVCEMKLRTEDQYCPRCGQRVNMEAFREVTL